MAAMKITHLVEASATGTLSMVVLLANGQAEAGHSVEVVYSERPESPRDIADLFGPAVSLKKVGLLRPVEKFVGLVRIRRLLLRSNPDVVFMHSSFAGFIGRLATLGVLGKTRFYYIPHCISFMRSDISRLKKAIFVMLEMLASLKRSAFLACSNSERAEIQKYIRFRDCRLIENAVEIHDAFDWKERPPGAMRIVVTVGQIREQKGPRQFARIAAAVGQKVAFVWIGDGDPSLRNELESAGVTVTGWMSRPGVLERLKQSDIYLSTSRWEGMPVAVIEAMGASLPVVASKCAGNVDVVDHLRTGLLFNDVEGASAALLSLVDNSVLARELASAAWSDSRRRFARERYLAEFAELIQSGATEKNASGNLPARSGTTVN